MTDIEIMIAGLLSSAFINLAYVVLIYCDLGDIKREIKEGKKNDYS